MITAAALSLAHGEPLEACIQSVASQHRCDVSPGLWSEIHAVAQGLR
jgi:hypothetical protein